MIGAPPGYVGYEEGGQLTEAVRRRPYSVVLLYEFEQLTKEQLAEIVELQLTRLRARLAERGVELELTDEAKEVLAEAGWDPTYGARPLKRALQRLVENPLALRLLEGDFVEGETVRVDARNRELVFEKGAVAEPAAA